MVLLNSLLVDIASFEVTETGTTAAGATKPAGPASLRQRRSAQLFATVAVKKTHQSHAELKLDRVLRCHDTSSLSSGGCSLYPRRIIGCDSWGIRSYHELPESAFPGGGFRVRGECRRPSERAVGTCNSRDALP